MIFTSSIFEKLFKVLKQIHFRKNAFYVIAIIPPYFRINDFIFRINSQLKSICWIVPIERKSQEITSRHFTKSNPDEVLHGRNHKSLNNLTPVDDYNGRERGIEDKRNDMEGIKGKKKAQFIF